MDTWLKIAAIIIPSIMTLTAALLPTRVEIKRSAAMPATNNPKPLTQRATGFIRIFWAQLLSIVAFASLLVWELSRPAPVDKLSVLTIAVCVASIAFQCVVIMVFQTVGRMLKALSGQQEVNRQMLQGFRTISEAIEEITKHLPDTPPQGITSKLRTALKNLLGD